MSERARRPTDDERTERFDPDRLARPGARIGAPQQRTDSPAAAPLTPLFAALEQDPTDVTPIPRAAADQVTLTNMDFTPPESAAPAVPRPPVLPAASAERRRALQHSEPIRVISMKDHAEAQQRRDDPRAPLQVQLRSMAEVRGRKNTPVPLGNLAPPRDPRQARARRVRANVIWAGVAIALACAIALAIWLVARR